MANLETIEHSGVITKIEGNTAYVSIVQQSACAGCHVKQMCSVSESKEKIIEAQIIGSVEFKVGDEVVVIGQKSMAFKAVLLAYILPFLLVIISLFVLNQFINSEIIVGSLSLCVLIPYFGVIRLCKTQLKSKFHFYVSKN